MKVLDIIQLTPYTHNALIVSIGNTQDEIWQFVKENYQPWTDPPEKRYFKKRKAYKQLIKHPDVRKKIKLIDNREFNGGVYYEDKHDKDSPCLLLLLPSDFSKSSTEDMITLAHEMVHVCQMVLPIHLNRDEEPEAEAYFHSHLMREVLEMMDRSIVNNVKQGL